MQDLQPYIPYAIGAVGLILALILLWMIIRLFNRRTRGRKGMRLGIVEYHEIDQSRRLVLLRRDDVEHLVLIGGNQDLVVESNISTGFEEARNAPAEDVVPLRQRPRPAVFGARRPTLRPVGNPPPDDPQLA